MTNVSNVFCVPQFQAGPEWVQKPSSNSYPASSDYCVLCCGSQQRRKIIFIRVPPLGWERISSKVCNCQQVFDINNIDYTASYHHQLHIDQVIQFIFENCLKLKEKSIHRQIYSDS